MSKYTAEDFANAEFAELPKYGIRAHKSAGHSFWQRDGITRTSNEEMADAGWVPVPDQVPGRTITESEFHETADAHRNGGLGWEDLASRFGITVIPDPDPDPEPEPTNLQRLSRAIRDWHEGRGEDRVLARHLNAIGVKAPGHD